MPKRNHTRQTSQPDPESLSLLTLLPALFPITLPGKRSLILAVGAILTVCLVGVILFWLIGPHWISPQQLLAFGSKGTEPGMFNVASYIGVDGQGNIYVADWGDGRINVFDARGKFLRLVDFPTHPIILGMAVAPDGTLYVSYDGKIHRLDAQGNETVLAYTDERGDIAGNISGIALSADGTIAAADNSGDILRFGADQKAKLLIARAYDLPSFSSRSELQPNDAPILSYDVRANSADTNISVAMDQAGDIYTVGWNNAVVLKTDAEGNSLSKFGRFADFPGGWERGLFDFPDGIAIDSHGRIYVGDSSGVQVFGQDQKYLYSIPLSGGADALTLDPDNNLYVVTYPPQVLKLAALAP